MSCFPNSFINYLGELVAEPKTNQYFILDNCETELDVKCKVLEWFSRGAYKSSYYHNKKKNRELHKYMLNGINQFLCTNFDEKDMETIYTYLGMCCNHNLTIRFITSNYDMSIFQDSGNTTKGE